MALRSYKELIVRQRAMDLVVEVYRVTAEYPAQERYGLAAHTRKTAISTPSNIAEGYARWYRAEYVRYPDIGYASVAELETQLIAAGRLGFLALEERRAFELVQEVERMLASLRKRLRRQPSNPRTLGPSNPGAEGE